MECARTHTLQRTCTEFPANVHRTYYRTNTVLTQHLHTADTELTQKLRRSRTERVRIFRRRHTAPAKSPNRTYAEHLHKRHVGMHTHISLALTRERATSAPIHTDCQPRLRARARGVKSWTLLLLWGTLGSRSLPCTRYFRRAGSRRKQRGA